MKSEQIVLFPRALSTMRHIQILMSYSRYCWGRAKSVSLSPVALSLWQHNGWNLSSGKPQNWKYFLPAPCRMSRQSPDTIYGSEGKCHGRKLEKQMQWCNGMKNEDICKDNKVEKACKATVVHFEESWKYDLFLFPICEQILRGTQLMNARPTPDKSQLRSFVQSLRYPRAGLLKSWIVTRKASHTKHRSSSPTSAKSWKITNAKWF